MNGYVVRCRVAARVELFILLLITSFLRLAMHRSALRPVPQFLSVLEKVSPFVPLPSLLTNPEAVSLITGKARRFARLQQTLAEVPRPNRSEWIRRELHLHRRAPGETIEKIHSQLLDFNVQPLARLTWSDVRGIVVKHNVSNSSGVVTPVVPYQLLIELVLLQIDCPQTRRAIEVDIEREAQHYVAKHSKADVIPPLPEGAFVQWFEQDVYLRSSWCKQGEHLRIPVVVIMGHVDHGKTTLLDALQHSAIVDSEPGRITQSIQSFTVPLPQREATLASNAIRKITFVDTPGHKIFVELRTSGSRLADIVLLIISLEEGVQTQTKEILQTALHFKRPVVVMLNKVDKFRDKSRLAAVIRSIASDLAELSVEIQLIDSVDTLRVLVSGKHKKRTFDMFCSSESSSGRKCLAVCASALKGTNLDLLHIVLQEMAYKLGKMADHSEGRLQAVVVESYLKNGRNAVSTVVRSGIAKPGIAFVVDANYGVITSLADQWGRLMDRAEPGMAVNVFGCEKPDGSPSSGTHVIEMPSLAEARSVYLYRRKLSGYVQQFFSHLSLLRPRGMPTHFLHIGDYGQSKDETNYEFKLLWKEATAAESSNTDEDLTWSSYQYDVPAKTEEEMNERMRNMISFGVLCITDTWHSGRLMVREIPRLGTKNVRYDILGAQLGDVDDESLQRYGAQTKLVINYRGNRLTDPTVSMGLHSRNIEYRHFDVYSDMVQFLKQFAVEQQRLIESKLLAGGRIPQSSNRELASVATIAKVSGVDVDLAKSPKDSSDEESEMSKLLQVNAGVDAKRRKVRLRLVSPDSKHY